MDEFSNGYDIFKSKPQPDIPMEAVHEMRDYIRQLESQRQWVDLTDAEILNIFGNPSSADVNIARLLNDSRMIEKALREKNT
jgi:hypothetical protein